MAEKHRMIGGSHERPYGPECRCGAPWDYWDDRCTTFCTCTPIPDTAVMTGAKMLATGCPVHDPEGKGSPDVHQTETPLEDLGELIVAKEIRP